MYRKKVQVEGTRSMTGEPVVFIGSERKGQGGQPLSEGAAPKK